MFVFIFGFVESQEGRLEFGVEVVLGPSFCLLYTSDAADE